MMIEGAEGGFAGRGGGLREGFERGTWNLEFQSLGLDVWNLRLDVWGWMMGTSKKRGFLMGGLVVTSLGGFTRSQ